MRRRTFIAGVAATTVLPLETLAQQAVLPVVGYLSARSAEADVPMLAAFRQGLAETGYVEGRGVRIEIRFADGQYDRLPGLMDDLVKRQVAAITTVAAWLRSLRRKLRPLPSRSSSMSRTIRSDSDWSKA
jgi:putative ABC transport system substrate-binding protein